MTKNEIIEKLAKEKKVEEFISNTAKTYNEDIKDLAQEIYMILLETDDEKIIELYENDELEFYVSKIITNQYRSCTSPFYTHYRKWQLKRTTYDPSTTPDEDNKLDENENYRWMRKNNSGMNSEN